MPDTPTPTPDPTAAPAPSPAPDPAPEAEPSPAPPERVKFVSDVYSSLTVFDLAGNQIQFVDGAYITQDPSWILTLDATDDVHRAR